VVFGRRPNTGDLGLETVGLEADERGFIPVGDYNQTAAKGVFAIGEVTSTPLLAHVASREGELAVEFIAGHGGRMQRRCHTTCGNPNCGPQFLPVFLIFFGQLSRTSALAAASNPHSKIRLRQAEEAIP